MTETSYTTRSMRRRRGTDKWEVTLSHANPITGETVRTYHTIEARTQRQAERGRDALILERGGGGGALATSLTLRGLLDRFVDYKDESGTIEPSTVRGYRAEAELCPRSLKRSSLLATNVPEGTFA